MFGTVPKTAVLLVALWHMALPIDASPPYEGYPVDAFALDGYEQWTGGSEDLTNFYKIHPERVTYNVAALTCQREGALLVDIDTEDEAVLVGWFYSRAPLLAKNDYLWIGMNDVVTEGVWVLASGEPISTSGYINWARGEPNSSGNEDCGTVNRAIQFNDERCSAKHPFLCERNG